MKIATWNVNSVRARLPNVLEWLKDATPDVVLLQEIKCETASFPAADFEAAGYQSHALGQKSYNGVAILSRHQIKDVMEHLPEAPRAERLREAQSEPEKNVDVQARYLEATIKGIRVASLYLPNGNPVDSEKYPYKLAWLERLRKHSAALLKREKPVVLGGDYNVIPEAVDVYNPKAWVEDALFRTETRAAYRQITQLGFTEAFRARHPDAKDAYSFWDYQAGAWQNDNGLRIDHFLLSPEATDLMVDCRIDSNPRGKEKASDHTPVMLELRD
jgi:exodeoxyribonuclease-3